ncbi:C40 family peptidase [Hymenobacter daeguensis]
MPRWLLPFLLLAALALAAYPRMHRRLLRYQRHRAAAATTAQIAPQLRDGDLIFHTSLSAQSRAIQLATHSPWSHCGIVYKEAGKWQVFEAVQPVKRTPLADWVARGQGGHFVTKRLRDAEAVLTPAALTRLRAAGQPMLGHSYDLYFGWSDDRIYCSELIWKVYERGLGRRLGQLQHLRDLDLSHPAVQAKLRERYGSTLPLIETVISPVSIFNSPELVGVLSR